MATFRSLLVALSVCALRVAAQCQAYGVDYSNGGAYNIDAGSNQYFSFISIFDGCSQEAIKPVLISPDGNQYACSEVNTTPAGQQVTSTCGIPFSSMVTGEWKIVLQGNQVAVQRTVMLTVGLPETITVVATPTVVVGITSTPEAITVQSTIIQTQTLILVPGTVTSDCNGGTQTVTSFQENPTATITSTLVRTETDGQVTSFWTTTMTSEAVCHLPNKRKRAIQPAAEAAPAAVTVTVTETTYTVTQTVVSTVAASTTTELVNSVYTATVSPPPSTVCNGSGRPSATVTVIPPGQGGGATVTQTNIVYTTEHLEGTVWVGQTEYTTYTNTASASACWRAGGWFGA